MKRPTYCRWPHCTPADVIAKKCCGWAEGRPVPPMFRSNWMHGLGLLVAWAGAVGVIVWVLS